MQALRTAAVALATVVTVAGQGDARAAGEPSASQAPTQAQSTSPAGRSQVEQDLERAARSAVAGIARGLQAAEHGVRVGAAAAARGIERGAQATARAADQVARQIERALPPAPPRGSERTGDTPGPVRPGRNDA